jgi:hypothetical protein
MTNTIIGRLPEPVTQATVSLKFIDGKLHQLWVKTGNGTYEEEWRLVPSEVTE